jgi:carboxylate-amine ligase
VTGGLLAAARNGLSGPGVDPFTSRAVPAWDLLSGLLGQAGKALGDLGDAATVATQLTHLYEHETGAEQQRRLWRRTASASDLVAGLAAMTDATR